MSERIVAAAAALRDELAEFRPALYSGEDCAVIAEALAATGKACDAARVLAAARAADCGAHRGRGYRNPVAWLAATSGLSAGAARDQLDTARAVQACPATKAALASGNLSLAQAGEIAKTEAVAPGSEADLIELAGSAALAVLKHQARKTRMAGVDADDLYRRQHQARQFRHWRDDLGMICVSGRLRPDVGIPFVHRLDTETDRLGRGDSRGQPRQARAADAFAYLIAGGGPGQGFRAETVILIDINAYRRGHSHPGETCRIQDGDPIPVWLAKQLSQDAFLKAVLHDGVAVHTVAHFGRHIPATLRTALELGAPPDFDGAACTDCGRRDGLEWDHLNPVANGGLTSLSNMGPKCWDDHHTKTENDRQAGLLGPDYDQPDSPDDPYPP